MPRKHLQPASHQAIQSRLVEILPTVQHPLQRQLLALGQSYLAHGLVRKAQAAIWSASEASPTSTLRGELEQIAREVRA
jgi:hypothetical protein